jgi:hypothetical protein
MVFDSHKHPRSAQQPTLDLQIPTVIFSPMDDHSTTFTHRSFEALKSHEGVLPSLTPDRRSPKSRQRKPRRTLSPRGETTAKATAQACQRLQQV